MKHAQDDPIVDARAPTRRLFRVQQPDAEADASDESLLSLDNTSFSQFGLLNRVPMVLARDAIVAFLAPEANLQTICRTGLNPRLYKSRLAAFALVCRRWNLLAELLLAQYEKKLCVIVYATTIDPGCIQIPRAIIDSQGSEARQLMLENEFEYLPPRLQRFRWQPLLQAFPYVIRLDLHRVCLSLMEVVLPLASANCVHIQALVLPQALINTSLTNETRVVNNGLTAILDDALHVWYDATGGLRSLWVSVWPKDDQDQYNDLLLGVATFCPQLERIHGWFGLYDEFRVATLGDVSLTTWTVFWQKCNHLREFSWIIAPLTPSYIERFRMTPKPHLVDLTIATSDQLPCTPHLDIVMTMLHGLPQLQSLAVEFHSIQVDVTPPMGTALDYVAQAVASNCPALRVFRWSSRCVGRRGNDAMVDDLSIQTLARCKTHKRIDVCTVRMTNDCLVETLASVVPSHLKMRLVQLTIRTCSLCAILHFLRFLEQKQNAETFAQVKYTLFIDGLFRTQFDEVDPAELLSRGQVETLVASIQRQYGDTLTSFKLGVSQWKPGEDVEPQRFVLYTLVFVLNKGPPRSGGGIAYLKRAAFQERLRFFLSF